MNVWGQKVDDDKVIESKQCNINYITTDIIYLLRIDKDDKSHYIYILKHRTKI